MCNPAFEAYYTALYGSRWQPLRESLFAPVASIPYAKGLAAPYTLDRASVLAAQCLRLPHTGLILDACAAPGGKSLVIASRMGTGVRLLANELSRERRRRLTSVLNSHLPQTRREYVTISGFDAAALAGKQNERERFATILLDAPCSSERHVLACNQALASWIPARPKFLARRQWALLSAAFLLLAEGGSLVYATCALTIRENDETATRLLEKYGPAVELDLPDFIEGEQTLYGKIMLPDVTGGMGPLYAARFKKRKAE